ncbi:hypothetical protein BHE74_00019118 [Ensete ventricosum]|uniref:Uncharacterized protein n=1 Tax=Ensete ventricosum TaxID=4639 RepID=A0A426YT21_ENSVE|nr:hypothetical protein B296_00023756 [Ensete ventricosum]RWW73051.1 hypothetical protein BHE74_00019118 [Ensete ventricosum]
MGGLCSKRSAVDKSPSDTLDPSGFRGQPILSQFHSKRQEDFANSLAAEAMEKRLQEQSFSFRDCTITPTGYFSDAADAADATELQFFRDISQTSRSTKSKPSSGKSGTTKASSTHDSFLVFD